MSIMKLGMATFLATLVAACSSVTTVSRGTPVDRPAVAPRTIQVAFHDVPYRTEKNLRIGYTLTTWEYEKENLELQKIVVLDPETRVVLLILDKVNLPLIYKDPLVGPPYFVWDRLHAYYLSLQLPIPLEQTPPKTVSHRFIFKETKTLKEVTVEGGTFSPRTGETPVVISSPLKGKNLAYINQSTISYNFNVLLFTGGEILSTGRYALDALRFSDDLEKYFQGDSKVNSSYFMYGATLHAVADGVVVALQDGLPENSGDARDLTFTTAQELPGNYVVLDIGGGRYATYAHCIPRTFRVRIGDRVREGDPIALVGNSGNSTAPHLRFQITDGPDLFTSRGLPFVLKDYTKKGTFSRSTGKGEVLPPQRVTGAMMEETTIFDVN